MTRVEAVREPVHFREAIDFFRSKANVPTATWTDLMHGAHARAFSVAGATSEALLGDLRYALDQAISGGGTLQQFRESFDTIVAEHGWSYRGSRGWRTGVIFGTNMRMAYATGRWEQIERVKARRPWLRYVAVLDDRTRDEHREWHDTVLPVDHPFWQTRYPPNGWNCRCTVQSLSDRDLERLGLEPSADPPVAMERRTIRAPDGSREVVPTPRGVDTGFGYNPGQSWLSGTIPPELRRPLPPPGAGLVPASLPPLPVRAAPPVPLLPAGLPAEEYARRFVAEFGGDIGQPVMWRDAGGTRLVISDELFRQRDGAFKTPRQDRGRHVLALARAIRDPDEIWLDWVDAAAPGDPPRWMLRRRYLARFDMADKSGGFAVFEWSRLGWDGVTAFPPDPAGYLDRQRRGVLLYRR